MRHAYVYPNRIDPGRCFGMIFVLTIIWMTTVAATATESKSRQDEFATIADHEMNEMQEGINRWSDAALVKKYQQFELTDEVLWALYQEFNNAIVEPPHPDQAAYQLTVESDRIQRITELGKRLHNMILAMPDDEFTKWGHLLMGMREILYLDSIHLPLAIKGNRSRDVYWYDLHNDWTRRVRELASEKKSSTALETKEIGLK